MFDDDEGKKKDEIARVLPILRNFHKFFIPLLLGIPV
jgi:hypothetical protein